MQRNYQHSLREQYPSTEFFWSVFSHIWTEYGEISKVDDGFLVGIFLYDGFSNPYRSDSNFKGGGGIALFASEDIPSILLGIENKPIEASLFRIKFAK